MQWDKVKAGGDSVKEFWLKNVCDVEKIELTSNGSWRVKDLRKIAGSKPLYVVAVELGVAKSKPQSSLSTYTTGTFTSRYHGRLDIRQDAGGARKISAATHLLFPTPKGWKVVYFVVPPPSKSKASKGKSKASDSKDSADDSHGERKDLLETVIGLVTLCVIVVLSIALCCCCCCMCGAKEQPQARLQQVVVHQPPRPVMVRQPAVVHHQIHHYPVQVQRPAHHPVQPAQRVAAERPVARPRAVVIPNRVGDNEYLRNLIQDLARSLGINPNSQVVKKAVMFTNKKWEHHQKLRFNRCTREQFWNKNLPLTVNRLKSGKSKQ